LLFDISKIKDLSLWNNEVKQAVSGMEWEEAQALFLILKRAELEFRENSEIK
jgi:hypothetical protein